MRHPAQVDTRIRFLCSGVPLKNEKARAQEWTHALNFFPDSTRA
jgi:hypothetical protein